MAGITSIRYNEYAKVFDRFRERLADGLSITPVEIDNTLQTNRIHLINPNDDFEATILLVKPNIDKSVQLVRRIEKYFHAMADRGIYTGIIQLKPEERQNTYQRRRALATDKEDYDELRQIPAGAVDTNAIDDLLTGYGVNHVNAFNGRNITERIITQQTVDESCYHLFSEPKVLRDIKPIYHDPNTPIYLTDGKQRLNHDQGSQRA